MSLIVAARFNTFDEAEGAARALLNEGVGHDCLHTFFVNPPGAHDRFPMGGDQAADPHAEGAHLGAVAGAAIVGVIGAIIGYIVTAAFSGASVPLIGAGVGAYIGSLAGAMYVLSKPKRRGTIIEQRDVREHEGRPSGVMLAVHARDVSPQRIGEILRAAGGVEVERAQGDWRNGKWQDFDPLAAPHVDPTM